MKPHLLLKILSIILFISCGTKRTPVAKIDLDKIQKRGRLIAMTGYSATSYFIYKGQPMGYEYELLTRLANHLGLELEIVLENNLDELFRKLNAGEGDLIAHGLTVTKSRKELVDFTDYLFTTQQVLVQRKPEKWRQMKLHEIKNALITNPIDLAGKKVYVKEKSSHYYRLKNLSDEIGGEIEIISVGGDTTSEQLMAMVAQGQIDYTIADQHVAQINQSFFDNLDVNTPISLPQQIAWAVRKTSPNLLQVINEWIATMKKSTDYYVIYNKYFKNRGAFIRRAKSAYLSVTGGKISTYDDLIKKQAEQLGWDWRLLAALVFQESQFDPNARSWSGAMGLMQLMPRIGKNFGAKNLLNPAENLKAGVKYLIWLDEYWQKIVPDPEERIKFILASYNVGIGHVQDARNLAAKYGKNPAVWEGNVAEYILKLSGKEFYTDPVVQYGYCRGMEPVNYVDEILQRFEQYCTFIAG